WIYGEWGPSNPVGEPVQSEHGNEDNRRQSLSKRELDRLAWLDGAASSCGVDHGRFVSGDVPVSAHAKSPGLWGGAVIRLNTGEHSQILSRESHPRQWVDRSSATYTGVAQSSLPSRAPLASEWRARG